jgi:steroid 5-alpha reductase family enzyme
MTILYLHALAGIAASLAILMAGARVVQQITGNCGWVDTIWTSFLCWIPVYVTGIPQLEAQMVRSRGRPLSRRSVAYQSVLSAAAASMIPKSGGRFSEKIMRKIKGVVT